MTPDKQGGVARYLPVNEAVRALHKILVSLALVKRARVKFSIRIEHNDGSTEIFNSKGASH